jgi:hypothetical protein
LTNVRDTFFRRLYTPPLHVKTDIIIHGPARGSSVPAHQHHAPPHQHWRTKKEKEPEAPKEREGNQGTHI